MLRYRRLLLFFIAIILSSGLYATLEPDYQVGISEKLNEHVPGNITVINEDSALVRLSEYFTQPTVLSLVYYNCPGLCTPIMDGIAKVIESTRVEIGNDYQVLTISFDPDESVSLAKLKKNNYMTLLGSSPARESWHFFTADSANISTLTESVGYGYLKRGNDFLHPAAIIILSPSGKIVKYLNGTKFNPVEFEMAIQKAGKEEVMQTITRLVKYCVNYDPPGRLRQKELTSVSAAVLLLLAGVIFLIYPPVRWKR